MGVLALGYLLAYVPFAALIRALSTGLVPGVDDENGGLVLLPAAAIGLTIGAVAFLWLSGWWQSIGLRQGEGRRGRFPGRAMLFAGAALALVVGTTIVNFTFVGISILWILLMMRAGTLVLAPVTDLVRHRRIRGYAWAGLGLSLLAIAVALGGVDAYTLTLGAVVSLCGYILGYAVRFNLMSRLAKTGDATVDRRYFAEEMATGAAFLLLICAVLAAIGAGPQMQALREGFTGFLTQPDALYAIGIGLFYAVLYVFGTLIYLDPREYTWAVPVNRGASVISVTIAAYTLTWLAGVEAPPAPTLVAAGVVLLSIAALSYPQLRVLFGGGTVEPPRRIVVFVCGANRGRSPIAAALMRSEIAGRDPRDAAGLYATSAGIGKVEPGTPMPPEAVAALEILGVQIHPHGSQRLTRELCESAAAIYCMTAEQRAAVVALAPAAAERTFRLDPAADLAEPDHGSQEAWTAFARRVRGLVGERLADLPVPGFAAAPV